MASGYFASIKKEIHALDGEGIEAEQDEFLESEDVDE